MYSMEAKAELNQDIGSLPLVENEKKSFRFTVYLAAFAANLYSVVLGMVEAYPAPATVDMTKKGSRFMNVTPDQITWIASLPVLASGIGCFVSGYASQMLGRRDSLILMCPLYVMSWLLIAYAPTITWIYAGRLLNGFCFGVGCVVIPAYITEISPVRLRGFLIASNSLANAFGCFIMITLAYLFRWSWLAVCGATLAALSGCLMFFMPESPEWLLRNSRTTEAIQSLKFFYGGKSDIDKELKAVLQNIGTQTNTEKAARTKESTKKALLRQLWDPTLYKPTLISLSLVFFAKCSGISIITNYTVQIFQDTGSVISAQSSTVLFTVVFTLFTLIATMLVDRVGRRVLYIVSGTFLTITLGTLSLYAFLDARKYDLSNWHWVPLISLFVYIAFFSLGIGPLTSVMPPEMVLISSRSTVLAIISIFSSLLSFLFTKLFAVLVEHLQYYGMFWTFAASTFFATLFGIFVLPETKGRAVREINNSFR